MNTFNMNSQQVPNIPNLHNLSLEANLIGQEPVQQQNQVSKNSNDILLQSNDDQNSTPKTQSIQHKNNKQNMKRSNSQLTDKIISKRSTKSVLNSNFSLEEQQEPESAETDFNSPVTSLQKHQTSKLKQKQINSSSQKKNLKSTKINQSYQKENNLRKKSFFEELEEIALSFMTDTNKKIKLDNQNLSQSSQTQETLSTSSNLINLYPTQIKQEQSQEQLSLIKEEEEQPQQNNYKYQKKQKNQSTAPSRGRVLPKKQVKNNQKQKQRQNKQEIFQTNDNINYCSQITDNNNQTNNSVKTFSNFPIQPKPIILTQNQNPAHLKQQNASKKLKPQRFVYAEEVYLKSISQEGSIKLQKFPCFKDSDLQIPTQFSQMIQQQYSDDDKCSGDELLEKAVNYMHKKLVESTIEQNPSAIIPDSEKKFTIRDIKIDRDSEELEDQEEEDNQYSSHSNHSQNSIYRNQQNNYHISNNFLSDDEEDDDYN